GTGDSERETGGGSGGCRPAVPCSPSPVPRPPRGGARSSCPAGRQVARAAGWVGHRDPLSAPGGRAPVRLGAAGRRGRGGHAARTARRLVPGARPARRAGAAWPDAGRVALAARRRGRQPAGRDGLVRDRTWTAGGRPVPGLRAVVVL